MRYALLLGIAVTLVVVTVALMRRDDSRASPVAVPAADVLAPTRSATADGPDEPQAPLAPAEPAGESSSAAPGSLTAAESVVPQSASAAAPAPTAPGVEAASALPETPEERRIRARTRAVPADSTTQTAAIAEAQTTGSHPERVTPLAMPAPFDAAAWEGNSTYRDRYIAVSVPGRVWQTAPPAADGIALASIGTRHLAARQGNPVELVVKGRPGDPVSWATVEGGVFTESETNALTVIADAEGVARAHFVAYAGTTDDCTILAASPRCIGQVTFQVIVTDGRP